LRVSLRAANRRERYKTPRDQAAGLLAKLQMRNL